MASNASARSRPPDVANTTPFPANLSNPDTTRIWAVRDRAGLDQRQTRLAHEARHGAPGRYALTALDGSARPRR